MMPRHIYRNSFFLALAFSILFYTIITLIFIFVHNALFPDAGDIIHNELYPTFIKHLIFNFMATIVSSYILFILNFKLLSLEIKSKMRVPFIILCTLVVASVLSYIASIRQIYLGDLDYIKPLIGGNMIRDLLIAAFISVTSWLLYLSHKQQQTALENRTLIAENMRTRYEALKNQVDPHFLFNALNTLYALIKIDADKAQQYVQQLSHVFRYTLQNREIILLEEELTFTRAYCHLMQIRYGDCLRFEYHIDPCFHSYSIIPLSLQVLVENAIKHNVVSAKQPLTISFVTNPQGSICVSNPIQLKKEVESGEGIGLVNLSERYRLMWQREIIVSRNDGIFRVEIFLNNHP